MPAKPWDVTIADGRTRYQIRTYIGTYESLDAAKQVLHALGFTKVADQCTGFFAMSKVEAPGYQKAVDTCAPYRGEDSYIAVAIATQHI